MRSPARWRSPPIVLKEIVRVFTRKYFCWFQSDNGDGCACRHLTHARRRPRSAAAAAWFPLPRAAAPATIPCVPAPRQQVLTTARPVTRCPGLGRAVHSSGGILVRDSFPLWARASWNSDPAWTDSRNAGNDGGSDWGHAACGRQLPDACMKHTVSSGRLHAPALKPSGVRTTLLSPRETPLEWERHIRDWTWAPAQG